MDKKTTNFVGYTTAGLPRKPRPTIKFVKEIIPTAQKPKVEMVPDFHFSTVAEHWDKQNEKENHVKDVWTTPEQRLTEANQALKDKAPKPAEQKPSVKAVSDADTAFLEAVDKIFN